MMSCLDKRFAQVDHRVDIACITTYILQILNFGPFHREKLQKYFGRYSKIAIASLCCQGFATRKQGMISITDLGKKRNKDFEIALCQNHSKEEILSEKLSRTTKFKPKI